MNYDLDKIIVLDDVVPKWLHKQAISQVLNTPVSYGHRGLGPDQGHQSLANNTLTNKLKMHHGL